MNQKPSKRITKIHVQLNKNIDISTPEKQILVLAYQIQAIVNYLDEEWEKDQPCVHSLKELGNICKRCNRLINEYSITKE